MGRKEYIESLERYESLADPMSTPSDVRGLDQATSLLQGWQKKFGEASEALHAAMKQHQGSGNDSGKIKAENAAAAAAAGSQELQDSEKEEEEENEAPAGEEGQAEKPSSEKKKEAR